MRWTVVGLKGEEMGMYFEAGGLWRRQNENITDHSCYGRGVTCSNLFKLYDAIDWNRTGSLRSGI